MTEQTRDKSIYILLAEDNPADVYLVQQAFSEHGLDCSLEVVEDGEAAIRRIDRLDASDERCPDLMLLDYNLPKKDGGAVLARLQSSSRLAPAIVIVFSSSESPRDEAEATKLGAHSYLRKPSTLDEFLEVGGYVKRLLEQRAAERDGAKKATQT